MTAAKKLKSNLLRSLLEDKPLIISGPCSAETEEQVLETARQLKGANIGMLRAGIWKPRTRPGTFEGIGEEGLTWLAKAKEETGLPIATEVANAKHVELALKHGVDLLWIGARTTVSPFAVQEIADALVGTDIPVLVKNPINPDIELWIGAIERFQNAGLTEVGAIHRGFSSLEKSAYRNHPIWELPIELKKRMPELPIICDPSHICGNRHMIKLVSEQALELDLDGLMIESHIDPDNAWSDAKQQILPSRVDQILKDLLEKDEEGQQLVDGKSLKDHRERINELDKTIISALAERMKTSDDIGRYKKINHMPIVQKVRWDEVIKTRVALAAESGLDGRFVSELYTLIHQESQLKQQEVKVEA